MNILIRNIDLLETGIGAGEEIKLLRHADIGISGDTITFVDTTGKKACEFKADRVLDGKNRLALPGLVNAHGHTAMTLMRNYADDMALQDWLFNRIFPAEAKLTEEDVYWGTLLGICEMLRSGTTLFGEMYLHLDAVARAVEESGIKANICRGAFHFNPDAGLINAEDLKECTRFFKEWNGKEGRIKIYIEVHSVYLLDEEALETSAQVAKSFGTGIHTHLLETERERQECLQQYGMSPAELCAKKGIFDVPVFAAHCVHLSDQDISLMKQYGVHAVHNPTSNLKLGSGIAPVPELLKAGVNVALGTDGAASNNNLNLFEEMHLAALLHKGVRRDPTLVNAAQAFRMATMNGAAAIGFGDETGCIREGMKADLVLLDTDKPHFHPMNDPVSALVYAAQASDVDTVLVNGNILMENREIKGIDEEMVKHKVVEASKRIIG